MNVSVLIDGAVQEVPGRLIQVCHHRTGEPVAEIVEPVDMTGYCDVTGFDSEQKEFVSVAP